MSRKYYFVNNPDNIIPGSLSTSILDTSNAMSFYKQQKAYSPTPLIALSALAKKFGIDQVYVKDESYRMGLNAFKGAGTLFAVSKLCSQNKNITTLCTATDGNHGRALAWSARKFGKEAEIVVPANMSEERIRAIENEGARVHKTGVNYDQACILAANMSKENSWTLIQDTSSEGYEEIPAYIMAGYLTIFEEMESSVNRLPRPYFDILFLQAGVGSFAAAAIWYYIKRYGNNRPKIVLTEPANADGIFYSFTEGCLSTSPAVSATIMSGLDCNTPSLSGWEIIKHTADISMKIDDSHSIKAMRELYYPEGGDERIKSGESGAAGLAGLLAILQDSNYVPLIDELKINSKTRVLLINTEGPTDLGKFKKIIR